MNTTQLWDFSIVSRISKDIQLIRNNISNEMMIQRISTIDTYDTLKTIVTIRHPNLMAVYDVVKKDGVCVSICEFIGGTTLQFHVENTGSYPVDTVKKIMYQVCDGLSVLHKNGIVHRDIKPENIMMDNNGNVKIIDYDITRIIKSQQNHDTNILGTAGYASPEHFGFSQTTHKADIYSCGVLMNYLLTAKLPNEKLYQGNLTPVIQKCIEIDEKNRFDSIDDLKKAILKEKANIGEIQFRPLPGFRGKHIFPKILMTIVISIWFMLLFVVIAVMPSVFQKEPFNRLDIIMPLDILFFWSAIPYFLFGDVFRLSEKIYPKDHKIGRFIQKALGFISFVFGFALAIIG